MYPSKELTLVLVIVIKLFHVCPLFLAFFVTVMTLVDMLSFQDAINSASSVTQTLSGELAEGHRKLLALAVAGANSKVAHPLVSQLSNGPLGALHEKVCFLIVYSYITLKKFVLSLSSVVSFTPSALFCSAIA